MRDGKGPDQKKEESMKIISSQRYTSDETVEAKRDAEDYEVTLGKVITIDGDEYRVLIDGHHSLAAAIADEVDPVYVYATTETCDREYIEDIDEYLESHWIDDNWYDIETGSCIWGWPTEQSAS